MKRIPDCRKTFERTYEILSNPYKGFTSFQHFRNEPLYSDCGPTGGWMKEHYPPYDWIEQNGRQQGYYPDTEIAYIRVLWKDFEPIEGEYNFPFINEIFQRAAEKGQSVMLRLMPHTARGEENVPDWLLTKMNYPTLSPAERVHSPSHPLFLERFSKAIEVLGNQYDGKNNFYAMDISLTGPWGEGQEIEHFPKEDIISLIDAYTSSFRITHLLGQICSPELINHANQTRPVGFRADGLGDGYHMGIYFPKNIYQMKDVWKKAPVSFESYWYLNEWKVHGWDIDEIIEQSLKWHISSINAKSSAIPPEWKFKIDEWIKKMGYRFSIRLIEYPGSAAAGDTLEFVLWIENTGVAPIYSYLPFILRLKNDTTKLTFKTEIDVRNWIPGDTIEHIELKLPNDLPQGMYNLECRLGGDGNPTVKFATNTSHTEDYFYHMTDIYIETL